MKPIIKVEGISKKYRIGGRQVAYDTLREKLVESIRAPFNGKRGRVERATRWVWALRNISFEVLPSEVVGIIGRNGAGKSTLLKILSRITDPTDGRVELCGRLGSLLEVGTGFHGELTGRENVYLNGAILGMTRREIQHKFDEIVSFAEIDTYLDTPVKHYSSGMYMRLAFAVAAHLDTEILIVDEVLAVGDTAFQKKCLTKMGAAATEGRTVLFVSHNLAAVRALCTRAILIDRGNIELDSSVEKVISRYLSEHSTSDAMIVWDSYNAPQTPEIRFLKGYILNNEGEYSARLDYRSHFTICVEYQVLKPILNLRVGFMLHTIDGTPICGSNDPGAWPERLRDQGHYITSCRFPAHTLNAGTYVVSFGSDSPPGSEALIHPQPSLSFDIEVMEEHSAYNRTLPGVIRPKLDWKVEKQTAGVVKS